MAYICIYLESAVDVKNKTAFGLYKSLRKSIFFFPERLEIIQYFKSDDSDFCLFADYPFRQMVFISPTGNYAKPSDLVKFSCTELWLYQFYESDFIFLIFLYQY